MYPRNAASPERIAIGPVVQISDGAVQASGVSIKVRPQGEAASAGSGTTAYEEGIVHYTPTQGETNYTSFTVIAYKTGCIPACATVVTSATAVAGTVDVGAISGDTAAADALEDFFDDSTSVTNLKAMFDGTGYAGGTVRLKTDLDTIKTQSITCSAGVTVLASVGTASTSTAQTGDSYAIVNSGTYGNSALKTLIDTVDTVVDSILVDTGTDGVVVAAASKTGYSLTATTGLGNQTANITGNLSGSVGSVSGNVTGSVGSVATGGIVAASFAAGAIDAAAIANGAIDAATFAADVDAEILSYIVDDATRIDASSLNTAAVTSIPAILADTGTDGVVVATASKTGYSLTATTGLGNQTANITGNLSGSVGSVTGSVGSVTGAVGSVTGAVGSVTGNVGGNVTGSVGSVATGGITSGSFAAGAINAAAIATGAIDADAIADNAIDAGAIASNAITADKIATGAIDADALAADAGTEIADAILNRDMSTGTDSGSATVRTVRQALRFLRNKWSISSTTLTVTKEDDSTPSWTAEVTTNAAADPVTGSDPASS
jgi:hypothetical protein